ncbi:MAG: peptidylprolyl isomerase [Bacteroidales bacterium]|nr:peptidylprolyl isomerase [Bacteroidales bacterium]
MRAEIKTAKGTMHVTLYEKEVPGTVANFEKLAESGFYDGLRFHRVIPGFVIQGGCPYSRNPHDPRVGTGGPGWTIKCETSAPLQHHDRGVLSMAHAGKDTGGSQFFICHNRQNTQHLDGVHTCFGRVDEEDWPVIDAIRPGDLIESVTVEKNN